MKQPNPLLPQGSFEAHARGKSHVRIAVFSILAIHVVVLGALLIQGCKRDDKDTASNPPTNDVGAVPSFTPSNDLPVTAVASNPNPPPAFATSVPPAITANTGLPPVPPAPLISSPATSSGFAESAAPIDHTIMKGDTFASLSAKYGVTTKAIQAANPDVSPTKLKIGQKIKIPAKSATAAGNNNGTGAATLAASDSGDSYVVKSGDTLGKIAKARGTTASAIQKMNNLPTTQIRVGQKLKLPAAKAASVATPNPVIPGGATSPGIVPTPPPAPAPAQ